MPHKSLKKEQVIGQKVSDVAVLIGLVSSKGQMNRLIQNKGAYLNNQRIKSNFSIDEKDLIEDVYLLFSAGKKNKILVSLK